MILKYLTKFNDKTDRWNYVDGIKEAGVFFDDEHGCTMIHITSQNGDEYGLALHKTAYLLNEAGKTIDRLTL